MSKPHLVILKDLNQSESKLIQQFPITFDVIPVLGFHFLGKDIQLDKESCLVFTSKNAVKWLSTQVDLITEIINSNLPVISIGPITSKDLNELNITPLYELEENSTSSNLARWISNNEFKNLIHLTSSNRRVELQIELEKFDIKYVPIEVYESNLLETIKLPTKNPDYIFAFSPRGIEHFLQSVDNKIWQNATFIAIGETTANFLNSKNIKALTPKRSELKSMLELIPL